MRDPARILIVDDTPTNVDILAKRLSALGYARAADMLHFKVIHK